MQQVLSFVLAAVWAGIGLGVGSAVAHRARTATGAGVVLVVAALVTLLAGVGLNALAGVPDVHWTEGAVFAGLGGLVGEVVVRRQRMRHRAS